MISEILNLFTNGSNRSNLGVMILLQNTSHHGKTSRGISLNSHYIVLFKKPMDQLQMLTYANKMHHGETAHAFNKKF